MLTASEAREMSKQALTTGERTEAMVEAIATNIKAATAAGRYAVENPWEGPEIPKPGEAQKYSLRQMLIKEGYKVKVMSRALEPGELPYTLVEW